MITVLITAQDDAAVFARLLTQLVPAAADGLVRDVLVRGAEGTSLEVALDAGATILADGDEPLAQARGDWIAGLPLTARLAGGWMETVQNHLGTGRAARLARRGRWPLLGGPKGWLAPKALASGAGTVEQDLERLARRSGRVLRIFDHA